MKLSEIIPPQAIVPDLVGADRDSVIHEMIDALEAAGKVGAEAREELLLLLLKREAFASTALGNGVAIPHAKTSHVREFCGAVGISRPGVDFGASDRRQVNVVFLFLSPEHAISGHLQLMAHIAGIARNQRYLGLLRKARTQREIAELLDGAESMLFHDPDEVL